MHHFWLSLLTQLYEAIWLIRKNGDFLEQGSRRESAVWSIPSGTVAVEVDSDGQDEAVKKHSTFSMLSYKIQPHI
jgi:hypothetical protein